jgi:hypothetical protein
MFRNWLLAIGWLSLSLSASADEDSWASHDEPEAEADEFLVDYLVARKAAIASWSNAQTGEDSRYEILLQP